MGLIQKKDQKDEIDGIEIIERSDTPNDLPENDIELVAGTSAEHIAAGTTAEEEAEEAEAQMIAEAADENLMPGEAGEQQSDDSDEDEAPRTAEQILADQKRKRTVFCAVAAALIVVAAIVGFFIGNGGFGAKGAGTATLSAEQLDDTVATYTYNGKTSNITAREAIESQYSIDNVKDDDGNYAAPSADTILSYVRTKIMIQTAEDEGITVSKKEMKKTAKSAIGTSNYKTMASQYGLTVKQAKQQVKDYALQQKLYKKVIKDAGSVTAPTAPTEPADENNLTDDEKAAYAKYIIELAGKKWDSKKNAWKSSKSTYAQQVGDFDGASATYEQAQAAYYVAYQEYSTAASKLSTKWTNYRNGLFADANIQIFGLYA